MTLTQSCQWCGESIAYEYATGDRSGLCWREACRQRRARAAEAARARQAAADAEIARFRAFMEERRSR